MTQEERYFIIRKAVEKYGVTSQLDMVIEECSELINAIEKYRRGRVGEVDIITEVADVRIMIEQLYIMFGRDKIENEIDRKLERLSKRIKE